MLAREDESDRTMKSSSQDNEIFDGPEQQFLVTVIGLFVHFSLLEKKTSKQHDGEDSWHMHICPPTKTIWDLLKLTMQQQNMFVFCVIIFSICISSSTPTFDSTSQFSHRVCCCSQFLPILTLSLSLFENKTSNLSRLSFAPTQLNGCGRVQKKMWKMREYGKNLVTQFHLVLVNE